MSVKVRIAPSPTGNLHVGTARTALFNWLFARANDGEFVLRIEDTDLERSKPEFEKDITEGLAWLGLQWDGEVTRQSARLDVYRKHLRRLLDEGKAVEKVFTDEEKEAITKEGRVPRDSIIVLRAPDADRDVSFDDVIRGTVSVKGEHVGSLALAKDEHTPLYNFAVVIDDLEMSMTHVIRGEDHISNTPKQLLMYEALDEKPPIFAHLPLILGPDRSKLSKRHGATRIGEYERDYLPQALVNFIGMLGYTYEKEILSLDEMAGEFDLGKVHKSGAMFDVSKLNWMNAQYMKMLDSGAFKDLIGRPALPDEAVPLMTERLERISDAQSFDFFWSEPEYESGLLIWKKDDRETALKALSMIALLADRDALNEANLDQLSSEHFEGKGSVYWPLRAALSGRDKSPGPLEMAGVLGSEKTRSRIDVAIRKLSA